MKIRILEIGNKSLKYKLQRKILGRYWVDIVSDGSIAAISLCEGTHYLSLDCARRVKRELETQYKKPEVSEWRVVE